MKLVYKRVLLKLSGESLEGKQEYGIDADKLNEYAMQVKEVVQMGLQVAIVIGGGNIFRGLSGVKQGYDRVIGDQMGMLATTINSLALQSELLSLSQPARVFTAVRMEPVGIGYSNRAAIESMQRGEVAIIAGGTGNPFFTTDSASALRAVEVQADILLKGTRVDGVYTADPEKDPTATKFDHITFDEVYRKNLKVMDLTAFTLCRENKMPIMVFNMDKPGNLLHIVTGQANGTLVTV